MTHEQLLRRVWGQDNLTRSGPVRAIVKRLRRKLGDDADDPSLLGCAVSGVVHSVIGRLVT